MLIRPFEEGQEVKVIAKTPKYNLYGMKGKVVKVHTHGVSINFGELGNRYLIDQLVE